MLAIVCPGQGSQTPGFLAPWLEMDGTRELLEELSDAAGVDLVRHGTVSDEETIKDTAVAQPLIVAAGLVAGSILEADASDPATTVLAGHSVGEITAAGLAGVLSPAESLALVRVRATGMAEAAAATPTGMAAVVGGDQEEVLAAIEAAGLTPANVNGAGQVVAAGTLEALADLSAPARARVIPLKVAGAFHTEHMSPAVDALAAHVRTLSPADPRLPLLSNRDGAVVASGAEVLERIVDQVTRPVRWDRCMDALAERGVTGVLELLPGGTLTGLAKRGLKGTATLALKSPEDLDAARAFLAEHSA
ncbi:ACP S-malonyltransferase [Micrococcus sp. EYE_162]|uniref:ACP S-malonyltransferase n=1 Tax=unclassified Micrococcus TaxID=2620948 RepID=UPI0020045254|nr:MULTISPECIES: ACP S-malonyltransferase [unclassified Micrococcus]MCK6094333.1 ACP S-malonyltransferase [Micrococcus sp. EYE_212]MCK6170514.1 ACP S-malonyltransferase [Micrococcus sp. EYE_162]